MLGNLRRGVCSTQSVQVLELLSRSLTTSSSLHNKSYRVAIVGGGTGGLAMANKLTSRLGSGNVAVIEPSENHYYKPMWSLVGAGVRSLESSCKPTANFIPDGCAWIKDKVAEFQPQTSSLLLDSGEQVSYDVLVVALGLQTKWNQVDGLPEALAQDQMVVSNYAAETVTKTFKAIQNMDRGTAIFTLPRTPISCGGAPQKIMYLADHYLRKTGKRDQVNVLFNSSLPFSFGVEKYAKVFDRILAQRNIQTNYNLDLIAVRHEKKEADFMEMVRCKPTGNVQTFNYGFMHVVPPMSVPDVLLDSSLADTGGYLNVNQETLQHNTYPNVFGLGDCINIASSKTAAAAACQGRTLKNTISSYLAGHEPEPTYDGYTCCPVITAYGKAVIVEYSGLTMQPLETIPRERIGESRLSYLLKKYVIPVVYWNFLLKGKYEGIPGKNSFSKRKCIQ